MPQKETDSTVVIEPIKTERIQLALVGTSPIILNRMSNKGLHAILFPTGRANAAERASRVKHDVLQEFRDSPYMLPEGRPTLLAIMASSIKGAMKTAALDLPGAKKAQIGRLVFIEGDFLPLYGAPEVLMAVVRSADINKTPDVRTRAIVPRWACIATIRYVTPIVRQQSVVNLLAAGGVTAGLGDWRPEKGSGSFGQFRVADRDDPELREIVAAGDRAAQVRAMGQPETYDLESTEMLSWFIDEAARRGVSVAGLLDEFGITRGVAAAD